jgi:outer membrane protein insertion porin family
MRAPSGDVPVTEAEAEGRDMGGKRVLLPKDSQADGHLRRGFSFIRFEDVQEGRGGNDVRKIEALYHNNGFLESKVFDPEVARGKKGLVLTIRVFEGKQFRVGDIRFAGESGMTEEKLRSTVKLAKGELFNREKLLADLLALTTLVNDEGYAQALVSPGVEKRKEYPVADVTYRFERGGKFRFGKVEVTGNTKTLDRVVRRNLGVRRTYVHRDGLKGEQGEPDAKSLLQGREDQHGRPDPGRDGREGRVQEGPHGTLSGGSGSSADKISGGAADREQPVRTRLEGVAQLAVRREAHDLQPRFRDPHFFDTDFSLLLSAYKTKVKYLDFEKEFQGEVGLDTT